MKTFTAHKLTDHMLQRLSAIVQGHKHKYGVSLSALIRRDLVNEEEVFDPTSYWRKKTVYTATAKGQEALEAARREGW